MEQATLAHGLSKHVGRTSRFGLITLLLALSASKTSRLRTALGDLAGSNGWSKWVFSRAASRPLYFRLGRRRASIAGNWGWGRLFDLLQSDVFLHRFQFGDGQAVVRAMLPVGLVLVHDMCHMGIVSVLAIDQTPRIRNGGRGGMGHGRCSHRIRGRAACTVVSGRAGGDVHAGADRGQLTIQRVSRSDRRRARNRRRGSRRIHSRVGVGGRMCRLEGVQPRGRSRNHGMVAVKVQTTHMGAGPRQNPVLGNDAQRRFHSSLIDELTKPTSEGTGVWPSAKGVGFEE